MKICLDKSVQYQLANIHKYKSSQRNQQLLQWSLFITNIPESKISAEHIWTIYRARWQIELLFKLYKRHIKIEIIKGKVTHIEYYVNYMPKYAGL
jgi:IS4 transposase